MKASASSGDGKHIRALKLRSRFDQMRRDAAARRAAYQSIIKELVGESRAIASARRSAMTRGEIDLGKTSVFEINRFEHIRVLSKCGLLQSGVGCDGDHILLARI